MRRFHSYGPVDKDIHYYAPRKELLSRALTQLMGENPGKGGHYFTVWAPRQCGKTWTMIQIFSQLKKDPHFDTIVVNLENLKNETDVGTIIGIISKEIGQGLDKPFTGITSQAQFQEIFKKDALDKPLILILDEFDALPENAINTLVTSFRDIYNKRQYEADKPAEQKTYLLHAAALIGVRSVLGIENQKGAPFNVQRSLHIPNLTFDEVKEMFQWYEKESGQHMEPAVIEKIYEETNGQPGLTCWIGEILTEGIEYIPNDISKPIGMKYFENIYRAAIDILPNNNILNIISKAKTEPYRQMVINLFKTDKPIKFRFDEVSINYLYLNGVIEPGNIPDDGNYVKFASPFVQKRLFNYFSGEIFKDMGQLVDSFLNIKEIVSPDHIDIPGVLELYQSYLDRNKKWLFEKAPRRSDMRVYEAVFHFNLYAYLDELLRGNKVHIFPEFPTGNGKIDLLVRYNNMTYGIELKSFTDRRGYREALDQAAQYSNRLGLREIYLVSFIESMDEENKKIFETPYQDPQTGVSVKPFFIQTGII